MVGPRDADRLKGRGSHLVALAADAPRLGARLGLHDEALRLEALHGVEHGALAQPEETGGPAFGLVESLPGVLEPEDAGVHDQVGVLEAQIAPHEVPDQDEPVPRKVERLRSFRVPFRPSHGIPTGRRRSRSSREGPRCSSG